MHIFVFIRRMSIQEAILVVVTQFPYSRGKKKNLIDRVTSVAVPYDGLNEDYALIRPMITLQLLLLSIVPYDRLIGFVNDIP